MYIEIIKYSNRFLIVCIIGHEIFVTYYHLVVYINLLKHLFIFSRVKRVSSIQPNSRWPEFAMVIQHASKDPETNKDYYFAATHLDECRVSLLYDVKPFLIYTFS